MTDKDFRYTLPDGSEVEAFQMTDQTRYREKDWPAWMSSKFLVTYEGGEQRLIVNDFETVIPKFGWIIRRAGGEITAVGYEVLEAAVKVVKEEVIQAPAAEVDEEGLLLLASKLSGKSVEDLRAEEAARPKPKPVISIVDSPRPEERVDNSLLHECRHIYELFKQGQQDDALGKLARSLSERTNWCSCSPGACDGKSDVWECRKNSPLAT